MPPRPSSVAQAMAAVVTLRDVERHDTVLVLSRHGWLCREMCPVIDEVEALVRARGHQAGDASWPR